MPSREIVEAFVTKVEARDFVGAIEQYYAADAATYENNAAPTTGRDTLVAKERAALAASKDVKAERIGPSLVEGDWVAIRWKFTFTNAQGVARTLDEIAWQTWRGNEIVEERFYYDPKQLAG